MKSTPCPPLRMLSTLVLCLLAGEVGAGLPDDWRRIDDHLERTRLLGHYMYRVTQPADGHAAYSERVAYLAEADSLGPSAWVLLDRTEQERRRRLAEPWRDRVASSRRVIGRLYDSVVDPTAAPPTGAGELLEGGAELVLSTLGALVNIVGLVPDDAESWADLGFFAGCVGDARRQEHALVTFCALHDQMAPTDRSRLLPARVRACLDLAWLARDRGEADLAVARCLEADRWLEQQPGAVLLGDREARLIAALARADQGRINAARELAAPLDDLPFRRRSVQTHRFVSSSPPRNRMHDFLFRDLLGYWSTHLPNTWGQDRPAQKGAWESGESNWARQWVQALVRLRTHAPADVLARLGEPDALRDLPAGLNHRYWNDWGRVYEQLGRPADARRCYALAAMHRPFFVYYPLEGRRGFSRLYTRRDATRTYFVGAGLYYVAGDRFAHAAGCLLAWEFTDPGPRRDMLRRLAEEGFTICRNRGIRPTASLAQRGRLRYLAGDLARAETDLATAAAEFAERDEEDPDILLMLGLVHFNGADYAGAVPWLEKFCRRRPEAGIGWRSLGLTAAHAGHLAAADSALSRAVALEPAHPGGWFNRGLVRAKCGRREAALADLDRAAGLLPGNTDVARVATAIASGPLPDITLSATPILLGSEAGAAEAVRTLQRVHLAAELGTPAVPDLLADGGTEASVADLEEAYLRDPSTGRRAALAHAYLREGRAGRTRELLAPAWETGPSERELLILLTADRELGESARAEALVHTLATPSPPSWSPAIWQLAAAICLEADLPDQAGRALEHAAAAAVAASEED